MSPAPTAPLVLVLGMHRSGTSAVTRVLNLLGFEVGADLEPAGKGSETGVWEHSGLVNVHDRLLTALGLDGWSDPGPLPDGWEQDPLCTPFRDELVSILRATFADDAPIVVKDPRLCRLTPLWWPVLQQLRRRAVCVLNLRHPQEVARSLAERNALSAQRSHLLWLRHVFESELATRKHPRVVLRYDRLLTHWKRTLKPLEALLGSGFPRSPAEAADDIAAFLQPPLRHHRFRSNRAWMEQTEHVPWIADAHAAALALIESDDAAARRRFTRLRQDFDAASRLFSGGPALRADDGRPAGGPSAGGGDPALVAVVERWDHGRLDVDGTTGELITGKQVEFELTPRHSNFCALELLVGTHKRVNTCLLLIEVIDSLGEVVDQQEVAADTLEDNAWFKFRFPPQPGSAGSAHRVRVTSRDADAGNAVSLYCGDDGLPVFRAYYGALVDAAARSPEIAAAGTQIVPSVEVITRLQTQLAELRRAFMHAQQGRRQDESAQDDRIAGIAEASGRTHDGLTRLEQRLVVDAQRARDADQRVEQLEARLGTRVDERLQEALHGLNAAHKQRLRLQSEVSDLVEQVSNLAGQVAGVSGQVSDVTGELTEVRRAARAQAEAEVTRAEAEEARAETLRKQTASVGAQFGEQVTALVRQHTRTAEALQALTGDVAEAGSTLTELAARLDRHDEERPDRAAAVHGLTGQVDQLRERLTSRLGQLDRRLEELHAGAWERRLAEVESRVDGESTSQRRSLAELREFTDTIARQARALQAGLLEIDASMAAGFEVIEEALAAEDLP